MTIDEESHPTVSRENNRVMGYDVTNPNISVDHSKFGQDESEEDNEIRQTEITDNVNHEGEVQEHNYCLENSE